MKFDLSAGQTKVRLALVVVLGAIALAGIPLSRVPNTLADQFGPAGVSLDTFGGHPGAKAPATGRFYASQISSGGKNRWWLVDPLGNAYYANGVSLAVPSGQTDITGNNPYLNALRAKYGNPVNISDWASDVEDRLRGWGYNALGSFSSKSLYPRLPHTVELSPLAAAVQKVNPTGQKANDIYPILYEYSDWDSQYRRYFFDVFHPTFQAEVTSYIASTITANRYADDQNLIGYFADNEIPVWYGRDRNNPNSPWYSGNTLADVYIALPRTAHGKQEWVSYLQARYSNDINSLNNAWGTGYPSFGYLLDVNSVPSNDNPGRTADKSAFLHRIIGRYFGTIRTAIKSADPGHMYLGARFVAWPAVRTPPEVFVEAGRYMDVISTNLYVWESKTYEKMKADLDSVFYEIWSNAVLGAREAPGNPSPNAGRPILVTEFSFGALDSGMPSTVRNGAVVDTQEQRAQLYVDFQRVSVESPYVVGHYWWSYFDPPPAGSTWGGENANLGVVDNLDKPYLRMLYRMRGESPNIYAYRGLEAPTGAILANASANTRYSGSSLTRASMAAGATPASTAQGRGYASTSLEATVGPSLAPASEPTTSTRLFSGRSPLGAMTLYLPMLAKNHLSGVYTSFYFTLLSTANSVAIDIHRNDGASATHERRLTTTGSWGAGSHEIVWNGLDNTGRQVGQGSFFFTMKVSTATGQKDYAMGTFTR